MYRIKQKSFIPKSAVLNEDMYLSNRKKLEKVEVLFDEALALVDAKNWRRSDRAGIQKIFDKISVIINKKFNVEMRLVLDVKAPKPSSIAYTVYTEDVLNILRSQVEEIIVNEKTGYSFIEVKKIDVSFELVALKDFLKLGTLTTKNGHSFKFEGRHMLSILLHEIGHNVFIPFYFDQDNDKNYRFKIGNGKPIIIYKDFLEYRSLSTMEKVVSIILTYIGAVGLVAATAGLGLLASLAGVGVGVAALAGSVKIASLDKTYAKDYMRNERNANTLPFQYGYIREMLEETAMIQKLIVDGSFNGVYKEFKKTDAKYWSNGGYQSIITKDIIGMLNTELSNPNNGEREKKMLKDIKDFYVREIKLIQAEMEIEPADVE